MNVQHSLDVSVNAAVPYTPVPGTGQCLHSILHGMSVSEKPSGAHNSGGAVTNLRWANASIADLHKLKSGATI